jgi:hypothetical protein
LHSIDQLKDKNRGVLTLRTGVTLVSLLRCVVVGAVTVCDNSVVETV